MRELSVKQKRSKEEDIYFEISVLENKRKYRYNNIIYYIIFKFINV